MLDKVNIYEYEIKIKDFIKKACEFHPIKILKSLYLYIIVFSKSNGKNDMLSSLIIYLINIYQSVDISKNFSRSHLNIEHIDDLVYDFSSLYMDSMMLSIIKENERSKVTRVKDVSHGVSYPFITLDVYYHLLIEQEILIKESYDISVHSLISELSLVSILLRSLPHTVDLPKELSELLAEIDVIFPDEYFDLKKQTKLPLKLLNNLGNVVGKNTDYLSRENKPGWIFVDLPTTFSPLLIYNEGVYLFHHNLFIDGLYRNIQRWKD